MRFGIVGAGAIGGLFAARLVRADHEVTLFHHRPGVVKSLGRNGLRVKTLSGKIVHLRIRARLRISKHDQFDFVLLTVKAYDTMTVARQLKMSLKTGTPVLTLQNGLGNIEILRRLLSPGTVLGGSTTEASQPTQNGFLEHTGKGLTRIGELDRRTSKRAENLASALRSAGFRSEISDNIRQVIWSKALINSGINPLTAINRLSNGEMARIPELLQLAKRIVEEGHQVGKQVGFKSAVREGENLRKVLVSSSRNKSSMLQDIERGRKTEVRQLNGAICELGKKHGVQTPYNAILTASMIELESFHP